MYTKAHMVGRLEDPAGYGFAMLLVVARLVQA